MTDATTSSSQATPGDPNISWPIERLANTTESEWHPSILTQRRSSNASNASSSAASSSTTPPLDRSIYPNGSKSLSGISLRAFLLGVTLGATTILTLLLTTISPTPFWRVPFFIAALSLFHFLEYYVTARYNTRYASVGAFLLTSNGWAYNVAHGSAVVECIVAHFFWPGPSRVGRLVSFTEPVFGTSVSLLLVLGFVLTVVGQVVRTLAMAQAANNFNHHVQSEHQEGHVLVKTGLYAYLRHPSYFGFFWWGLGTQLVLGNVVCFVGYTLVLWRFFSTRIKREFSYERIDVLEICFRVLLLTGCLSFQVKNHF
jgi:protein-S-isoprenylcysteine O-methyltransferase